MGVMLDIGCGCNKQPGTISMDRRQLPGVDVVCDFERASREAFVDPTHVRFITDDTFKYFEATNCYGLKVDFRTVSMSYKMRKPSSRLPAHFQKRARRYLWNACIEMDVVLEAVKT